MMQYVPPVIKINPLWENISIMGTNQTGKTTLARELVRRWRLQFNIAVYDPHGYENLERGFTQIAPECVKHTNLEITGKGLEIIQPHIDSKKFFDGFCNKVMTLRNLITFMDELHNNASKHRTEKSLDLLARNCNNRNIGYVAIFQRPAEIPNYILANSTHRFFFFMDLVSDRKFIENWTGVTGLDTLNQLEYFYQRRGSQNILRLRV